MAKNLDIIILFDIYGEMLTQKQQDFISYYYNDDLSLAEIAENEGITRQGVRDAIKRAEAQLIAFEEHLGLNARLEKIRAGVDEIEQLTEFISDINVRTIKSKEIIEATERISALTRMIGE